MGTRAVAEDHGGWVWLTHTYASQKNTDLEYCLLLLGCLPIFRALLRLESYLLGCSSSATGREGGDDEANLFTMVGPGHCSH
jgi:hypothetical protein